MEDNKYLEVLSDKINLTRTASNPYYESKITLTNLTSKYVVFKVYINKHTLYSANPASSFIPPKENISITVKRLENTPDGDPSSKDKLFILAFPVNQAIHDPKEVKNIIKKEHLHSPNSQEIYIEIVCDTSRVTIPNLNAGKFALDETNYEISSPKKNLPIKEELEEYKKKLEAIKSSIQDYQTQNDKLNHQLNNLTTNTSIYDIKSNVLRSTEKEIKKDLKSYPLSFVILLVTLGLCFGAYLNRITEKWV